MARFKESICEFDAHDYYYVQDNTDCYWMPGNESVWYLMGDPLDEYCSEVYGGGEPDENGDYVCYVVNDDCNGGQYAQVFHKSKLLTDDEFEQMIRPTDKEDEESDD